MEILMEVLRDQTKLPAASIRSALRKMEERGEVTSSVGWQFGNRRRAWRLEASATEPLPEDPR